MEGIMARLNRLPFLRERTKTDEAAEERTRALFEELEAIAARKRAVECAFEAETNQDLIDACILELGALEKRHAYLIKQAKRQQTVAF